MRGSHYRYNWALLWTVSSSSLQSAVVRSFSTTIATRIQGFRSPLTISVGRMSSTDAITAPPLIDVDCNLIHPDLKPLFEKDADENEDCREVQLLQQDAIQEANIIAMLSPSSTLEEARRTLNLIPKCSDIAIVRATVGIHPYHVNDEEEGKPSSLEEQMQKCSELLLGPHASLIAAVGECGLDASDGFPPLEDQIPYFRAQIALSEQFQKPLFVHERLAHDITMELLEKATVPVIIHCFTGSPEECRAYVQRGYYISLSGYICKDSSDATFQCLLQDIIPIDRLMIETDAPYMGFPGCRDLYLEKNADALSALNAKKRKRITTSYYPNVPSSLPLVLDRVVEALQLRDHSITRSQVAWQTSKNANDFFQFQMEHFA